MGYIDQQIAQVHVENADTASTAIGAASAIQRYYVLALYYRNGTGGALAPKLISNAKTMWSATAQAAGASGYYTFGTGLPVSDGVNQAVTFSSTASATSDLTVWGYYGP